MSIDSSEDDREQMVKAISELANAMSPAHLKQLYEFASFLQGQMPLTDEVDWLLWSLQFSKTDDEALTALAAAVERVILKGEAEPMFDERGEFTERNDPSAGHVRLPQRSSDNNPPSSD